jgi:hypothetical protein
VDRPEFIEYAQFEGPHVENAVHASDAGGRVANRPVPTTPGIFTAVEKAVKGKLFGCRMCAQCALPSTAYACPMSCPKELRNGPCGGVAANGDCEVYPGLRCVWLVAYERAAAAGRTADLRRLQRPIDQREWGLSSWVNYWQNRDAGLWNGDTSFAPAPPIEPR